VKLRRMFIQWRSYDANETNMHGLASSYTCLSLSHSSLLNLLRPYVCPELSTRACANQTSPELLIEHPYIRAADSPLESTGVADSGVGYLHVWLNLISFRHKEALHPTLSKCKKSPRNRIHQS